MAEILEMKFKMNQVKGEENYSGELVQAEEKAYAQARRQEPPIIAGSSNTSGLW